MPTFSYTPSYGAQRKHKPRMLESRFGDGYAQRTGEGINNDPQVWDLVFAKLPPATADAVMSFLSARGGYEAFDWTNPDGATLRYVCKEFNRTYDAYGGHTVTATFEQDFAP